MRILSEKYRELNSTKTLLVCAIAVLPFNAANAFDSTRSHSRDTQIRATQPSQPEPIQTVFNRTQWDLSDEEWTRYQELMRGIRGSLSPKKLSPVEVLGIHARSQQERRRYAMRWAKMMLEDTERVLAFQQAYDDAWKELNPSGLLIDVNRIERLHKETVIRPGDRVLFFTALADCPACEIALSQIARVANTHHTQLDIYFMGTQAGKDNKVLKTWAKQHPFNPTRLKQKKITFNHDNGMLYRLAGISATVPKILRIRGKDMTVIDINQL